MEEEVKTWRAEGEIRDKEKYDVVGEYSGKGEVLRMGRIELRGGGV